ncbi:MAG: GntR family transcriptional regulator, partial [Desulfatiglandaceae bacterium]
MTSRKIEPIKKKDDIERIRSSLHSKPRDLLLFDLVTQSGVGMKYLLRLKVKDLLGLQVGDRINCGSMKANTVSEIIMSERLYRTWQNFLNAIEPAEDEFLLKSRKGNKPLNIASVSTMVRIWFRDAGLKRLSGTKSLQKTWERHFRSSDGVSPNSLQRANSEPAICPIEVETVKDKVYREISRAIMTGRLAPGERLLEAKIAGQMNVSRMPVREALHRLQ